MDLAEHTTSSETVFDGKLLHVRRDTVSTPSGECVREYVMHPGASAVVPLFDDGTTLLVRQYRYAPRREFLEVPAGKIDAGETARAAAIRELREEVGLESSAWTSLGAVYPTIGYSDEVIHLFLAEHVHEVGADLDDGEHVVPVRLPFSEAVGRARLGELPDAKTALALLRADAVLAARET